MNRMNQGIAGYVAAFSDLAFNLLPTILYLALSVTAMFRLDWRLALAVIILLVALRMALGLAWRPDEIFSIEYL